MDWGDYTPGPWRVERDEGDDPDGPNTSWPWRIEGVVNFVEESYEVSSERAEADARLISKAYLIPRLEAALEGAVEDAEALWEDSHWTIPEDEKASHPARVLLAELRAE